MSFSTTNAVHLESDDGRRLVKELREAELCVLVGSGISSFKPTSLPTGMALGRAIAEQLAAGCVVDRALLVDVLAGTAFEHVMERCPDHRRVREVFSRRFAAVQPNPVHHALTRLVASGPVRHLVTPNYDVALERAFGEAAPPVELALVRGAAEAPNATGDPAHVLFKIHGCATPSFAAEMVFRLRDEAQLEPWKRETLRKLVAGRVLTIVAYSGMDFEICPELPRMGASRLVWLHYGDPAEMTSNARRVVRESGGVILLGDVRALAGGLLGEAAVDVEWAPATAGEFVADLFSGFDEEDLDAWRTRLFGEIGCARDAIASAERLLTAAEARGDAPALGRALVHRGRGLFHQGRYFDAAGNYARAAKILRKLGDVQELRGALNGIVESNRCAGRYVRTIPALRELGRLGNEKRGGREQQHARMDRRMLGLLLRRHAYQLVSLVPRRSGLRRLRKWARVTLRECARRDIAEVAAFAAEVGNWLQLQQTMLWANRYGLHWDALFHGTMNPLPSREGYRQLGYLVARSMAVRDQRRPPEPGELQELLNAMVEVEAWPEAWKLARFGVRQLGPGAVPPALLTTIDAGWKKCQYSPSMRWAREKGVL